MSDGVSLAHARRLARSAPATSMTTGLVSPEGKLHEEIQVDIEAAGLRRGKAQDVRIVLFEADRTDDDGLPVPIATADGRHALAIPLSIRPRDNQAVGRLRVDARLPHHAGRYVRLVV